jgi:hypothetical protein
MMDKTKLLALIAALYLLEIKERAAYVKTAAKENGVDEGELFKELKEAGYNPKAEKGSAAPAPESTPLLDTPKPDDKKPPLDTPPDGTKKPDSGLTAVTLRHKTEYPLYRREGLVLKQTPGEFRVTAKQLAVLKNDKWVEIVKEGEKE